MTAMKTSTQQPGNFRPAIGRFVTALAIASVMGGMAISPALGQYNQYNDSRARPAQDRNQNADRNQNGNRYQNDNRNRNARRDQSAYRPAYQHPYRYSQPVYAPPTSYYYPQQRPGISLQSPGINLFFPLDIR
jgi:hypothetical protein